MNRHWNMDIFSGEQPGTPANIRFYYTDADLTALQTATGNNTLTHTNLNFNKSV